MTMVECQALEEADWEEERKEKEVHLMEVEEECIEEADEGELLVLRRALSSQKAPNPEEQRENIFHTRCTIHSLVCSLIVDGGICANVASTTLVDKLQLKAEAHPQPYSIRWLNQGKGLKVSSRCLISLSIGKNYVDDLWCDILPMDACHILLGRPWLYDRKVTHDGFQNTYSLHQSGRKITLAPLPPQQIAKPKTVKPLKDGGILLTLLEPTLKVEQREFKAFKEMFLHAPSQTTQTETPLQTLAKQLLLEFSDVFLEDIPQGLPPKRSIQHHIDHIPRAILDSKPAFRMNPKDTLEIQRQVEELISMGLVHERLSPCVVPPLLMPKEDGSMRMYVDSGAINKITIKY